MEYTKPARSYYSKQLRNGDNGCNNNLVTKNNQLVLERYKYIPQGGNWKNIPNRLMGNYADKSRCHTGIYKRLKENEPSVVIGNYRKNMLIHPTEDRGLSVREAARLQSFPDWFEFKGTIGSQQQQVGNAAPPFISPSCFLINNKPDVTRDRIVMTDNLLPLERWFKSQSSNGDHFPNGNKDYFERYKGIKAYLIKKVYPSIGDALSAEDHGIYTDHGLNHFEAVIRYAGKLLSLTADANGTEEICISPYEVFVLLVSILLHDTGNIYGRRDHEKHPFRIFTEMGKYLCPDKFEAKIITQISAAHGGTTKLSDGNHSKDTIKLLNDKDEMGGISIKQRLIAALLRFSDEICEDRDRADKFMLDKGILPKESEVFHAYAYGISSVGVDHESKSVNLKIELMKNDVTRLYGKGSEEVFLIDEIFSRLEKMYSEMLYCQRFMSEYIKLDRIRATIIIYDDKEMDLLKEKTFNLEEEGYPLTTKSLHEDHPEWGGSRLKEEIESI